METPPPVFVPRPASVASELLRAVISADEARRRERYEVSAGKAAARWIAETRGMSWADAWNDLGHVPNTMLDLLRSADGWAKLGEHIGTGGELTGASPRPTVH